MELDELTKGYNEGGRSRGIYSKKGALGSYLCPYPSIRGRLNPTT